MYTCVQVIAYIDKSNILDTFSPTDAGLKEDRLSIPSFNVCCFGRWYA